MRISTKQTLIVTLDLEEAEARWLMMYLQNSPMGENEPADHEAFRGQLFTAIQKALPQEGALPCWHRK